MELLKGNVLGELSLEYGDKVLGEKEIRSTKLTILLAYLLIEKDSVLTTDKLMEALWKDDDSDNPAGALKNLIYRLRTLLKKTFGVDDFIITNHGAYQWNPSITVRTDVELFGELLSNAKSDNLSQDAKSKLYEQAFWFYNGDFVTKAAGEHWGITINNYYHSLYMDCAKSLSEIYVEQSRYEELESICMQALRHDNSDEWMHYYLIIARVRRNKWQLAMESYEKAKDILTKDYGVSKFPKLEEAYEELLKSSSDKEENADIESVEADLVEENPTGAFLCGYPVFRELYRLAGRKGVRHGDVEYILLLTVDADEGVPEKVAKFRIKNAMQHLEDALVSSLRIGDVATRYNSSQFIVLLPNCDYDGCVIVANRIISKIQPKVSGKARIIPEFKEMASFVLQDPSV